MSICTSDLHRSDWSSTVWYRRQLRRWYWRLHLDAFFVIMEAITVPSPSSFLQSPILQASIPPKTNAKNNAKRKSASTSTVQKPVNKAEGPAKPKQSKSRNGMRSKQSCPVRNIDVHILFRLRNMQAEAAEVRWGKAIVPTVPSKKCHMWRLQEGFQMACFWGGNFHNQTDTVSKSRETWVLVGIKPKKTRVDQI